MAEIFSGKHIRMGVNEDLSFSTPNYVDPGYKNIEHIVAFPEIQTTTEIKTMESYNEDFNRILAGGSGIASVSIALAQVEGNETQKTLDAYHKSGKPLRFRIMWVEQDKRTDKVKPTLPNGEAPPGAEEEGLRGPTVVFDAYVSTAKTAGSNSSAVTRNYTLTPYGSVTREVTDVGEYLRRAQFGVGAGTPEFTGPVDLNSMEGNRWVTLNPGNSQNPFPDPTAGMSVQNPNDSGWSLVGSSRGAMVLRARNRVGLTANPWVKIFTSEEPPSAKEIGAIGLDGGKVDGDLQAKRFFVTDDLGTTQTTIIDKTGIKTNALTLTGKMSSENSEVKNTATINKAVITDGKITTGDIKTLTSDKATIKSLVAPLADIDTLTVDNVTVSADTTLNKLVVNGDAKFNGAFELKSINTDEGVIGSLTTTEIKSDDVVSETASIHELKIVSASTSGRLGTINLGSGHIAGVNNFSLQPSGTSTIPHLTVSQGLSVVNNASFNKGFTWSGTIGTSTKDSVMLFTEEDQNLALDIEGKHTRITAGAIYINGKEIWHQDNVPNVVDMGAVPLNGNSTITGSVTVTGTLMSDTQIRVGNSNSMNKDGLLIGGAQGINILNSTLKIRDKEVFHPENPPTAAQVKAVGIVGNSRINGNLTANELYEYNEATSKAVRVYSPLNKPTSVELGFIPSNDTLIDFGEE